jgi:hypothetical protein
MKIKLDVGCGSNKKEGFVGIDLYGDFNYKVDLNKDKFPFQDNTVVEFYSRGVLGYLKNLKHCFDEIHRVAMNKAKVKFLCYHFTSYRSENCFRTRKGFRSTEFNSNNHLWHETNLRIEVKKVKIHFHKGLQLWNYLIEPLVNISNTTKLWYETTFLRMFPAEFVEYDLEVIK